MLTQNNHFASDISSDISLDTLVLATNNQGKIREFKKILSPLRLNIISQHDLQITSCAETGLTFVENSIIKARYISQKTNLPTLADDSGLVVPSLNGQPGIYSARFAGESATDSDNINKVLALLDKQESTTQDQIKQYSINQCSMMQNSTKPTAEILYKQRQAYFYCCLVFLRNAQDPTPVICHGKFYGIITKRPSGTHGFGYDPIFWLEDYNCTVAELDVNIKNTISHRAIALNKMLLELKKMYNIENL